MEVISKGGNLCLQWLFVIIAVGFAGWALWRGYEAYSFRQLLSTLDGQITDSNLRRLLDRLTTHNVPNAKQYWDQLRALDVRVANARGVSTDLKAELKTLLDAKATNY